MLTGFIPMLMGTGGNSGSQSSTAVIRSLSIGDTEPGDILQRGLEGDPRGGASAAFVWPA